MPSSFLKVPPFHLCPRLALLALFHLNPLNPSCLIFRWLQRHIVGEALPDHSSGHLIM